jgi:hypothetical protein
VQRSCNGRATVVQRLFESRPQRAGCGPDDPGPVQLQRITPPPSHFRSRDPCLSLPSTVPVTQVSVPVTQVSVPVTQVSVPVTQVSVPVTQISVPVTQVSACLSLPSSGPFGEWARQSWRVTVPLSRAHLASD